MKRVLLASAALMAAVTSASAQHYIYPPQVYGPGGYYSPPPPRHYYRPDPYGGWVYHPRPVQFGNLCLTSRGTCYTRPRPVQSSCSCFIEGFGPKRGGVIASGW